MTGTTPLGSAPLGEFSGRRPQAFGEATLNLGSLGASGAGQISSAVSSSPTLEAISGTVAQVQQSISSRVLYWLNEPAFTSFTDRTNEFSHSSWVKNSSPIIVENFAIGPTGARDAAYLEDASSNRSNVQQTFNIPDEEREYCAVVWVRRDPSDVTYVSLLLQFLTGGTSLVAYASVRKSDGNPGGTAVDGSFLLERRRDVFVIGDDTWYRLYIRCRKGVDGNTQIRTQVAPATSAAGSEATSIGSAVVWGHMIGACDGDPGASMIALGTTVNQVSPAHGMTASIETGLSLSNILDKALDDDVSESFATQAVDTRVFRTNLVRNSRLVWGTAVSDADLTVTHNDDGSTTLTDISTSVRQSRGIVCDIIPNREVTVRIEVKKALSAPDANGTARPHVLRIELGSPGFAGLFFNSFTGAYNPYSNTYNVDIEDAGDYWIISWSCTPEGSSPTIQIFPAHEPTSANTGYITVRDAQVTYGTDRLPIEQVRDSAQGYTLGDPVAKNWFQYSDGSGVDILANNNGIGWEYQNQATLTQTVESFDDELREVQIRLQGTATASWQVGFISTVTGQNSVSALPGENVCFSARIRLLEGVIPSLAYVILFERNSSGAVLTSYPVQIQGELSTDEDITAYVGATVTHPDTTMVTIEIVFSGALGDVVDILYGVSRMMLEKGRLTPSGTWIPTNGNPSERLIYGLTPYLRGQVYDRTGNLFRPLSRPDTQNLVGFSEDFSQWATQRVAVTSNTDIAPDGLATADTLTLTASTGQHFVQRAASVIAGRRHYLSCYFKKGTARYAKLFPTTSIASANAWASFDLQSGSIEEVGSASDAYMYEVASGWYLCVMGFDATVTDTNSIFISFCDTAGQGRLFSGEGFGTESILAWGYQMTIDYPRPYVRTDGGSPVSVAAYGYGGEYTAQLIGDADVQYLLEGQFGPNLLQNSNNFNAGSWDNWWTRPVITTGHPDPWGGNTASSFDATGPSSGPSATGIGGKSRPGPFDKRPITASIWLRADEPTVVDFGVRVPGSAPFVIGTEWQRIEHYVASASDTTNGINRVHVVIVGVSQIATLDGVDNALLTPGSRVYMAGAMANFGEGALPYVETDNSGDGGPIAKTSLTSDADLFNILTERPSENRFLRSNEITNASWTRESVTVSQGELDNPVGDFATYDITDVGDHSGFRRISQTASLSGHELWSMSAIVKRRDYRYAMFRTRHWSGSGWNLLNVVLDMDTGNVTSAAGLSGRATLIADGWWLFESNFSSQPGFDGSQTQYFYFLREEPNNGDANYQIGDPTKVAGTIAHMQLEPGWYATSPIPTTTTVATRLGNKGESLSSTAGLTALSSLLGTMDPVARSLAAQIINSGYLGRENLFSDSRLSSRIGEIGPSYTIDDAGEDWIEINSSDADGSVTLGSFEAVKGSQYTFQVEVRKDSDSASFAAVWSSSATADIAGVKVDFTNEKIFDLFSDEELTSFLDFDFLPGTPPSEFFDLDFKKELELPAYGILDKGDYYLVWFSFVATASGTSEVNLYPAIDGPGASVEVREYHVSRGYYLGDPEYRQPNYIGKLLSDLSYLADMDPLVSAVLSKTTDAYSGDSVTTLQSIVDLSRTLDSAGLSFIARAIRRRMVTIAKTVVPSGE